MNSLFSRIKRLFGRIQVKFLVASGILKISSGVPLRILDYKPSNRGSQKRALLYYLPEPVVQKMKQDPIYNFSNKGIAWAWAQALRQLGYTIDIVGWDDSEWSPMCSYDLVVAHGGKNTPNVLKLKAAGSRLIYFATGTYWKTHNKQGQNRADFFYKRHGTELLADRQVESSEEEVLRAADSIIALGTEVIRQSYGGFPNVYALENGAYLDGYFPKSKKDYDKARNNFLFFAGGGNMHKGLDLVLDAFKDKSQHLYICTSLTKEFEDYYGQLLHNSPNIHYEGVVGLRTKKFYKLMDTCAYAILPSAAEGCPGSIVDCMQEGLIPVVTKETGIAIQDFGFTIDDINPASISALVDRLSKLAPSEIHQRSQQSYQHVFSQQSSAQFKEKLTSILRQAGA